ncbi:MAG: CsgG/HfaB family protein [Chloroherpetonaceae bacterium]
MKRIINTTLITIAFVVGCSLMNFSSASAQKIGVLTFEDASGIGGDFGEQVAKFIRSEMLRDKKYLPKFIRYQPKDGQPETVDVETALEIGRKNGVDYVVIGTILEAESRSSSTGIGGISVMGQNLGTSARSVSSKITLQGDLVSIKEGKLLESFRTDGSATERSVGANVSTEWGSFDGDAAQNDSPTAKALREATERLVKEMSRFVK